MAATPTTSVEAAVSALPSNTDTKPRSKTHTLPLSKTLRLRGFGKMWEE